MRAAAWTQRCPDDASRAAETLMARVGEGKLRPHVDRVLPLERVADAMSAVANRSSQDESCCRSGEVGGGDDIDRDRETFLPSQSFSDA